MTTVCNGCHLPEDKCVCEALEAERLEAWRKQLKIGDFVKTTTKRVGVIFRISVNTKCDWDVKYHGGGWDHFASHALKPPTAEEIEDEATLDRLSDQLKHQREAEQRVREKADESFAGWIGDILKNGPISFGLCPFCSKELQFKQEGDFFQYRKSPDEVEEIKKDDLTKTQQHIRESAEFLADKVKHNERKEEFYIFNASIYLKLKSWNKPVFYDRVEYAKITCETIEATEPGELLPPKPDGSDPLRLFNIVFTGCRTCGDDHLHFLKDGSDIDPIEAYMKWHWEHRPGGCKLNRCKQLTVYEILLEEGELPHLVQYRKNLIAELDADEIREYRDRLRDGTIDDPVEDDPPEDPPTVEEPVGAESGKKKKELQHCDNPEHRGLTFRCLRRKPDTICIVCLACDAESTTDGECGHALYDVIDDGDGNIEYKNFRMVEEDEWKLIPELPADVYWYIAKLTPDEEDGVKDQPDDPPPPSKKITIKKPGKKAMKKIGERLAEATHNAWLEMRKAEGWHHPDECPVKDSNACGTCYHHADPTPDRPKGRCGHHIINRDITKRCEKHMKRPCKDCHDCMVPYSEVPPDRRAIAKSYPKQFFKIIEELGFQVIKKK